MTEEPIRQEFDEPQAGFAPPKVVRRVSEVELAIEQMRGELLVVHSQLGQWQSDTGAWRGEIRALMAQLATRVSEITREMDAERGRKEAERQLRAQQERRAEQWSAWGRALLPFAVGVALTALAFFVDERLS